MGIAASFSTSCVIHRLKKGRGGREEGAMELVGQTPKKKGEASEGGSRSGKRWGVEGAEGRELDGGRGRRGVPAVAPAAVVDGRFLVRPLPGLLPLPPRRCHRHRLHHSSRRKGTRVVLESRGFSLSNRHDLRCLRRHHIAVVCQRVMMVPFVECDEDTKHDLVKRLHVAKLFLDPSATVLSSLRKNLFGLSVFLMIGIRNNKDGFLLLHQLLKLMSVPNLPKMTCLDGLISIQYTCLHNVSVARSAGDLYACRCNQILQDKLGHRVSRVLF